MVCISISHVLLSHHSNFFLRHKSLYNSTSMQLQLRLLSCMVSSNVFSTSGMISDFLCFPWTMKDYKCIPLVLTFAGNASIVLHGFTCIPMPWQHLTLHMAVQKEEAVKVKMPHRMSSVLNLIWWICTRKAYICCVCMHAWMCMCLRKREVHRVFKIV
jgi:hypothetical protein